jgi:diguanylate cyclase (GGDEF)-like protein/PAS domain S-box-containing protein
MLEAAALALELWLRDERAQAQLETYEHIVANTQDQIALVDEQLRFKVVNAAYAARLGLKPEELEGRYLRDIIFEDDFASLLEPNLKKALNGSTVQFQHWRSAPNGQRMYMNVLYTPYEEHRGIRGVIASVHDISSLYKAEEKLRRAAQVFNSSAEAVLMTDVKGNITDANEAFAEITGYSVDEVLGRNASIIRSDRHPQSFYDEIFNSIRTTGRWRGEIWIRRRNGDLVPCLTTVARVLSDWGELNGYVGVFSDISNIKDNEHRLELLAHHDPLTGLSNRTQLSRSLQNRISRARSEQQSFTLMFIDLDHFKDINDALGHSAGDALLQLAGERLLGVLRDGDVLARVGGDEFVVMLQGMETAQNASTIATKIIEALKQTFSIAGNEVHISASVGICCYPEDGTDAETLLRNADTAMYEAKSAGRGTWRCYSQEMTEAAQRHMTLLAALRQARARGELYLVYQPKFDAHSEALSGFEALLRWRHSGLGAVNTQEFILVAEQAGLISELDYWVLDEVCSQIKDWRQQGLNPPRIAVNISARTLHDTGFIATVSKLLTDHQISSDSIQLELTETALLPGVDGANKALSQIRELGLGIAVDDFGTGYSSLSYLRTLPVTELKIDASFVRDVVSSPDAATIAETIFAMAKSLKLQVVAEGVETRAQLDFLRNLGPLQIQGFYLSRPLSVDDTQRLLTKETAA